MVFAISFDKCIQITRGNVYCFLSGEPGSSLSWSFELCCVKAEYWCFNSVNLKVVACIYKLVDILPVEITSSGYNFLWRLDPNWGDKSLHDLLQNITMSRAYMRRERKKDSCTCRRRCRISPVEPLNGHSNIGSYIAWPTCRKVAYMPSREA